VHHDYNHHQWDKEVEGMNAEEKGKYLIEQAHLLEDRVDAKDLQYRYREDRVKAIEDTNDMLIDAIKAKIAILDAI
jgi:hypothetical protein